jgi:hypothetical protein
MTALIKTCLSLMLANQQTAILIPDPVQNLVKNRIQKQWSDQHPDYPLVWDRDECSDQQSYTWNTSEIQLMGLSYSITDILDGRALPALRPAQAATSPGRNEGSYASKRSKVLWWVAAFAGLAVGGAVIAGRTQKVPTAQAPQSVSVPTTTPRPPGPELSTGVSF